MAFRDEKLLAKYLLVAEGDVQLMKEGIRRAFQLDHIAPQPDLIERCILAARNKTDKVDTSAPEAG